MSVKDLTRDDIEYITDLRIMRYSWQKIAEIMEVDAVELEQFWEGA